MRKLRFFSRLPRDFRTSLAPLPCGYMLFASQKLTKFACLRYQNGIRGVDIGLIIKVIAGVSFAIGFAIFFFIKSNDKMAFAFLNTRKKQGSMYYAALMFLAVCIYALTVVWMGTL